MDYIEIGTQVEGPKSFNRNYIVIVTSYQVNGTDKIYHFYFKI